MITRRQLLAGLTGLTAVGMASTARAAAEPHTTVDAFYSVLLAVMKDGPKLGFAGRREKLAPAIRQAFDLPAMTRLVVGLQWQNFSATEQEQLVGAFSDFSIATYASQFDDYSGERFDVDPKADPAPGNDVVVRTKLVQPNDKPVQLDYLLRNDQDKWRIIDIYLSGTVSQLAARRSEFSSVLRQNGVTGLVALLKQKTAQLASS
jgi:phospholipid transport system substrate-binding protein